MSDNRNWYVHRKSKEAFPSLCSEPFRAGSNVLAKIPDGESDVEKIRIWDETVKNTKLCSQRPRSHIEENGGHRGICQVVGKDNR